MPDSYIPSLMTVGGTLLAAAFTSVIAQYLFAPALEARKQRLLDRSRAAATTVERLREIQFWLEVTLMHMRIGDSHYELQRAKFDERATEFDALLSLAHSGLPTKYTTLALNTQLVTDVYSLLDEPNEKQIDAMVRLIAHTIGALDPVNLPWTRSWHCRKGLKAGERILDSIPGWVDPGSSERRSLRSNLTGSP